jgi:hypothetical protein
MISLHHELRSQFRHKEPNYFVHTVTARLRQSPSR